LSIRYRALEVLALGPRRSHSISRRTLLERTVSTCHLLNDEVLDDLDLLLAVTLTVRTCPEDLHTMLFGCLLRTRVNRVPERMGCPFRDDCDGARSFGLCGGCLGFGVIGWGRGAASLLEIQSRPHGDSGDQEEYQNQGVLVHNDSFRALVSLTWPDSIICAAF